MKKRHSIHLLLAAAALLLAMAACTKDELADGNRLPEGQYPLEIARITLGVEGGESVGHDAPVTRRQGGAAGPAGGWAGWRRPESARPAPAAIAVLRRSLPG